VQHLGHHGVTAKHSSHKHASHRKGHHQSRKHHVKTHQHLPPPAAGFNPLPVTVAKPAKPRTLSPGAVALCPAEAVAVAARIAGWAVTDGDVLDLYARCADGPSAGFTIATALTAGLPGMPLEFDLIEFDGMAGRDSNPQTPISGLSVAGHLLTRTAPDSNTAPGHPALILGVDLPGPHAVTVAPDGCWVSWGQHYDPAESFPDAVIEEAWLVRWSR